MTTPSSIEERIARLEGSFEQIERRLGTLEQDMRSLRTEMTGRFDRVDNRIDRLFYWQLGLLGATSPEANCFPASARPLTRFPATAFVRIPSKGAVPRIQIATGAVLSEYAASGHSMNLTKL